MTVSVLRPDSVIQSANPPWSIIGGAASHNAAQADNSDATASRATAPGGQNVLLLQLGNMGAVAANQRIAALRARLRAKGVASSATDLRAQLWDSATVGTTPEDRWTTIPTVATDLTGAWRLTDPAGAEWTKTVVDRLGLLLTPYHATTSNDVFESYVDVDLRTQLTTTVTAPTGTITTTSQPNVNLSLSDPDGQSPTLMTIRVFTQAVYSAGGFDPATSTAAVWEFSGTYTGIKQIGTPLANSTTYRAYATVAKDFNGQSWYSAWAFSTFTISITPPTAPTISLTANATLQQYSVAVSTSAPPVGATAYAATVWRRVGSVDGGGYAAADPWEKVYATALPLSAGAPAFTFVDRTPPRNRSVTYRATVTATVSSNLVTSNNTDTAAQLVAPDKRWLLKSVSPADGSGTDWIGASVLHGPAVSVAESQGVYRPLGRRGAVVVSSGVHGEDGSYAVTVYGAAEWASAKAVLTSPDPVWVSDPFGGNKFVRFTSRDWELLGTFAVPRRPVTVSYVEVDDPRVVT